MKVLNVHQRELAASPEAVGELLDSLSSRDDALWPKKFWPRMAFDRPLDVGAVGGHGPIRYVVEKYEPGKRVTFRLTGPKGFDGHHALEVVSLEGESVVLTHRLEMTTHGFAVGWWPLVVRPLHDALVEDAFTTVEIALGLAAQVRPWSGWVRFVRWVASGGKARPQVFAGPG